ncbi:MAG: hypothetical protein DDT24_00859 [Chloroflexi bacterium]|nr:hypothetical protein [Chloroflexota bacterium]
MMRGMPWGVDNLYLHPVPQSEAHSVFGGQYSLLRDTRRSLILLCQVTQDLQAPLPQPLRIYQMRAAPGMNDDPCIRQEFQ